MSDHLKCLITSSVCVTSSSLARQLQKEVQSTNSSDFTEEQKVILSFLSPAASLNQTHLLQSG